MKIQRTKTKTNSKVTTIRVGLCGHTTETDDAIKWKSKIPSETTPSAESTPIINMEELSKYDFDVKNYENPPLINNIAEALEVCHSRYEKLKKKNNQQKDEHDMVQVGIASIMQMHCNDTGTKKS
jgi:hypothetical protein